MTVLAGRSGDVYLGIYGAVGGVYLVSRFALALCYRVPEDRGIEPMISLVVHPPSHGWRPEVR